LLDMARPPRSRTDTMGEPREPRAAPVGDHPFANATISFAVDRSGSTVGRILECELNFVREVATILSKPAKDGVRIIPWESGTEEMNIRVLRKLDEKPIYSIGGTSPVTLLSDQKANQAIRESSLWFLMTDGVIGRREQERFANAIPASRIHGIACVTVIFGNPTEEPTECNISVGVSMFAVCPNCLFLFYNTGSGDISIMQAKGIFRSLLPNGENPTIGDGTSWESFPRMAMNHLTEIVVPAPKKLNVNEIALQDGFLVNIKDVWENNLTKSQTDQIFANQSNMQSIIMAAQTRGVTPRFQTWIQQQKAPAAETRLKQRKDVGGRAAQALRELVVACQSEGVVPESLRKAVRVAHLQNMRQFLQACQQESDSALERKRKIDSAFAFSTMKVSRSSALNAISGFDAASSSRSSRAQRIEIDDPEINTSNPEVLKSTGRDSKSASKDRNWGSQWMHLVKDDTLTNLLWTPGFTDANGSFKSECSRCGLQQVTMAWLFTKSTVTSHPYTNPLGSRFECLSLTICCEPCASYCRNRDCSPNEEYIVTVLPMVTYLHNSDSYDRALLRVFRPFSGSPAPHLGQLFLSTLLHYRFFVAGKDKAYEDALDWTCRDLLESVQDYHNCPITECPTDKMGNAITLGFSESATVDDTKDCPPLISYPLKGFIIALAAASMLEVPRMLRHAAAFRRYLFALTECLYIEAAKWVRFSHATLSTHDTLVKLLWDEKNIEDDGDDTDDDDDTVVCEASEERAGKKTRLRRLSLNMEELLGSPLLDEQTYKYLQEAAEFRYMKSRVGPATALFVHALVEIADKETFATPLDLFKFVMMKPQLSAVVPMHESMDVDVVRRILSEISL